MDAATSKNSGMGSIAAVARDSSGSFLGASTVTLSGMSDPETLEVMACREGLALASDLIEKVRLASDSKCSKKLGGRSNAAVWPYCP